MVGGSVMARIFIDGFESGDHDMWDAESNATVISSAGLDMDGDYCLDLNNVTEYLQKSITAVDKMYFAFLWRPDSSARGLLAVEKSGTLLMAVRKNNSLPYKLEVLDGVAILATGTKTISLHTTYLIEVYIKIHDSAGEVTVKVDGVQDINITGDTKVGVDTQFDEVLLGYYGSANSHSCAYFDNFIMDDVAWIGDTKIQAVVPTGAGNSAQWDFSAGANWQCVDEKPPNDADYVSTNVNDETDSYAAGNMVGSIGSVKCVQVQSRTKTEGAPTPTNLKLVVRSGGADYLSGDKAISAAEKGLHYLWEDNPADSLAWEENDVNNMEIGVKSAA